MTAAGKTFAASSAGDWRADSRWAAGHARSCADEAGATGRQPAGVSARWRDAAGGFDRDADEGRGLCSGPRAPRLAAPRRRRGGSGRSYDLRPSSRARMVPVRRIPPPLLRRRSDRDAAAVDR